MTFSQEPTQRDTPLPSLNAIRSFAVAAKYCSFTKAAAELCVTQSAVSRIVRELETDLGVPLLRRIGRSLELTPEGSSFYAQIAHILERITAATRSIQMDAGAHILSIGALPTFTIRWLLPRLPRFQERHPDIFVDLIAKNGPIDFSVERIDVGILFGRGIWDKANATLIISGKIGIFCAPSFLKQKAPLRKPGDLLKYPLLQNTTLEDYWQQYFATFGIKHSIPSTAPSFEHFFMIIEAAAAGMGLSNSNYGKRTSVRTGEHLGRLLWGMSALNLTKVASMGA